MKYKKSPRAALLLLTAHFLNVNGMEIQKKNQEQFDITTKICELPVAIMVNHIIPFILPLDDQTLILRFLLKDIEKGEQKDGIHSRYAEYKSTIKKWIDLFPERKRGGMRLFRLMEGSWSEIRKAYPELKEVGRSVAEYYDYEKRKEIAEKEIKNGADVNIVITCKIFGRPVESPKSLLGYIAASRKEEKFFERYIMELLLKSGADKELHAPLVHAVREANLAAVQILIDAGVNVNVQWKGYAALNFCVEKIDLATYRPLSREGHNMFAIFELLLKRGADINVQNEVDGNTPLLVALGHILLGKNLLAIKELLERGANITLANKKGERAVDFLGSKLKEWQEKNPGEALYQEILNLLEQADHNAIGKKDEMQN